MSDIRHRIGIRAPRGRVHEALTTTAGIGSWWIRDTTGDAGPGGTIHLDFGPAPDGSVDPQRRMAFDVLDATAERVEWRCTQGPAEWQATTFTFDLCDGGDDETVVLFAQAGWPDADQFRAHCTTKWGSYLLGMKALLEGGVAHPSPDDPKVSTWD